MWLSANIFVRGILFFAQTTCKGSSVSVFGTPLGDGRGGGKTGKQCLKGGKSGPSGTDLTPPLLTQIRFSKLCTAII